MRIICRPGPALHATSPVNVVEIFTTLSWFLSNLCVNRRVACMELSLIVPWLFFNIQKTSKKSSESNEQCFSYLVWLAKLWYAMKRYSIVIVKGMLFILWMTQTNTKINIMLKWAICVETDTRNLGLLTWQWWHLCGNILDMQATFISICRDIKWQTIRFGVCDFVSL